jgi:predicted nuclease of predicted toxin-antitoxin system
MRLLFDQNLSPRLVNLLADFYSDALHVVSLGLERASDEQVRDYAREHGLTIVTKDGDFSDLSVLRGFPPRVIRLRVGNCTTFDVEILLRTHRDAIQSFDSDPDNGTLELLP